jgi:periplasmic protein TonB
MQRIQVLSGHPLLVPAALEAVKTWVYQPTLLNGQPVEVETTVDVNFPPGL